jgi:hypothetical protein
LSRPSQDHSAKHLRACTEPRSSRAFYKHLGCWKSRNRSSGIHVRTCAHDVTALAPLPCGRHRMMSGAVIVVPTGFRIQPPSFHICFMKLALWPVFAAIEFPCVSARYRPRALLWHKLTFDDRDSDGSGARACMLTSAIRAILRRPHGWTRLQPSRPTGP